MSARVLGVDPGQRRVGLALSDEATGSMALPFATVERGKDEAEAVKKVVAAVRDLSIGKLIVGLPLRLDGSEGTAARRARAFGDALGEAIGVPVRYWDERLSTLSAERSLRELGVKGKAQRKVVDQAAAAIVLQSFLDSVEHGRSQKED